MNNATINLLYHSIRKPGIFKMTTILILVLGFSCSSSTSTRSAFSSLNGSNLVITGRNIVGDQKAALITSGAHFGITFTGDSCVLIASISDWQDHNYLQYELDGVYQKRLVVRNAQPDTLHIIATSPGEHTLKIFKATEAHTGPVFIHEVRANQVKPLAVPFVPIIEFIGNSITCGAASDASEVPCGTGVYHDQHNAYMAYGPRVAREVNADFVLSSVSGIGIYRNWNSERPIMPEVYEKVDFQENTVEQWNFDSYKPRVISVALGTNDFSRGDGKKPRADFDSAKFITGYVDFLKTVREKYPDAPMVLMNSPMIPGKDNEIFISCLKSIKRGVDALYPSVTPITLFFFQPMVPRGCSYHPSVEDHKIMADQLVPLFRTILSEER